MGSAIDIPSPPLPPPLPEGDPADAETAARRWAFAANVIEAQQDYSSGAAVSGIGESGSTWASPAAGAYVNAVAPIARETGLAYDALTVAARGVTAYADRLTQLRHRHDALHAEHTYLTREVDMLSDDVARMTLNPGHTAATVLATAHLRAIALARQIDAYTQRRSLFRRDIAANETDLSTALHRVTGLRQTSNAIRGGTLADSAVDLRSALDAVHRGAVPSDIDALTSTARGQWWSELTAAEQEAVTREIPEHLAHAGGLPSSARNAANRVLLDRDIAAVDAKVVQRSTRAPLRGLTDRDRNVREIRAAVDRAERESGGEPVTLYDYDPDAFGDDGRAVIGIGDMDRASNVSFSVPGLGTTARTASDGVGNTLALHKEAKASGGTVATVAWIGYDAPSGMSGLLDVAGEEKAAAGGDALAADLRDFAVARDVVSGGGAPGPSLHVIGHSYGSTTVGFAGADGRLAGIVDTVTLLGSPGAGPIARAEDFGIGASNVFVAADDMDPVAHLGAVPGIPYSGVTLGNDPLTTGFGAQRFGAEGASDSLYIDAHTGYFEPGSESLRNLAAIVSGHGDDITHDSRRGILDCLDRTELLHLREGLPGLLRRLPLGGS